MSASAPGSAPLTEREILNSLHLTGRRRPWYASLFDEENNRGMGIKHIIIIMVSVTICLSVVSLMKSSGAKVPTLSPAAPNAVDAMSVHYLDFGSPNTIFVVARGETSVVGKECDRIREMAAKEHAPLVVIVGGGGNSVKAYISECGTDDEGDEGTRPLTWMFAVDQTITTAMKKNVLADNHFFSVVRKRAGYELLTAKPGPAASYTSPVGRRIASSPYPKVLITNSVIKLGSPAHNLAQLATKRDPNGESYLSVDVGAVGVAANDMKACKAVSLSPAKAAQGKLSFACVDNTNAG